MASKPKPTDPTPPSDEPVTLADDRPVTGQRTRHDGWIADRQRILPTVLAETGCRVCVIRRSGVSSRSTDRLNQDAPPKPVGSEYAPYVAPTSPTLAKVA